MALTKISRGLLNTGVSDSSDATAITIDSSENVLIGTTSGSDPLVVSDSGASSITARFINTNADANPANIRLQKLSGSPADADYIGMINVSGENDASEETIFQSIDFISTDVSDGTEDGVITFRTRGAGTLSERIRITESGGLKFSTPVSFVGQGNAVIAHHSNNYLYMYGGSAGLIHSDNETGSNRILIRDSNSIEFEVNGSERVRIDSSGNFLHGGTSPFATGVTALRKRTLSSKEFAEVSMAGEYSTNDTLVVYDSTNSATRFKVNYQGTVYATSTTISSLSDERLKENVRDLDKGLADILKLKPRRFDWKAEEGSGKTDVTGFIAQECETAGFEEFVDTVDFNETIKNVKTFGYGGLVPALVKSIQELSTKLEAAEARITTLEG